MAFPFWLLALPLYLAWCCLARVPQLAPSAGKSHRWAYPGVVLGSVGLLLPAPWLLLRTLYPTVPPVGLAVWLALLLGCCVYPLTAWALHHRPLATLRRWLLWTADAAVVLCLAYRWL